MLAGLVAALSGFFTSVGASSAVAGLLARGALQLGASILFSTVSGLFRASSATKQEIKRELARPTSDPAKRFVYGYDLAVGTQAPVRVRGSKIYGFWLLNSRPSALFTPSVYFDKRELAYTGNPRDFTESGGATVNAGTLDGLVKFWFQDGTKTSPPWDFLDEVPRGSGNDDELFDPNDKWLGVTGIWAIIDAGPSAEITERWINAPPLVEVYAGWSRVWDPRDETQSLDDPDTWEFSDNHALCCLDAATQNPIRGYVADNLHLDQFIAAADAADELVEYVDPITTVVNEERRYRVSATIVWDNEELWSKLASLYAAGAANPTGDGGVLGIAPGVVEPSSYTLTDFIGRDFEFQTMRTGDQITQLRTKYTSIERFYEPSNLAPYDIPGVLAAVGGLPRHRELNLEFAGSPYQAMRVERIEGGKLARQKTLTLTAPPDAANLVSGSVMTVDLPAPYDPMNGQYVIVKIAPQTGVGTTMGGQKVSLLCPLVAEEYDPAIFGWDALTDQQELLQVTFNPSPNGVSAEIEPPFGLTAFEDPAEAGSIAFRWTTPDDSRAKRTELLISLTSNIADAVLMNWPFTSTNVTYTQTTSQNAITLGSGQTRYFWARSTGNFGSSSEYVGPVSATTD